MYDTCIFDLYGTLVDIRTDESAPGLWEKLALFYSYYGASWQPEELRSAYGRLTLSMSEGHRGLRRDSHEAFPEIRIEDVFRDLFRRKGIEPDDPLIIHAGQFFRVLSTRCLRLYEGTAEMLSAVRAAGKKLYLLSNAQKIFTRYEMRALGISSCFDGIYISSEHGCKKPDLLFFEKLLSEYQICRETAIMIGNDGVCDISGARQAGLHTLYVRTGISPKEEPVPDADHVLDHMDMKRITEILTA